MRETYSSTKIDVLLSDFFEEHPGASPEFTSELPLLKKVLSQYGEPLRILCKKYKQIPSHLFVETLVEFLDKENVEFFLDFALSDFFNETKLESILFWSSAKLLGLIIQSPDVVQQRIFSKLIRFFESEFKKIAENETNLSDEKIASLTRLGQILTNRGPNDEFVQQFSELLPEIHEKKLRFFLTKTVEYGNQVRSHNEQVNLNTDSDDEFYVYPGVDHLNAEYLALNHDFSRKPEIEVNETTGDFESFQSHGMYFTWVTKKKCSFDFYPYGTYVDKSNPSEQNILIPTVRAFAAGILDFEVFIREHPDIPLQKIVGMTNAHFSRFLNKIGLKNVSYLGLFFEKEFYPYNFLSLRKSIDCYLHGGEQFNNFFSISIQDFLRMVDANRLKLERLARRSRSKS